MTASEQVIVERRAAPDPDTIREDTQVRGDVQQTIRAALKRLRDEEDQS